MAPDDIGRLAILICCTATLPLIVWAWHVAGRDDPNRSLMWFGFAGFLAATAARNAVGLRWLNGGPVELLAILCQLLGLVIVMYGFLVVGLAARRRDHHA